MIEAAKGQANDGLFEVWEDNLEAVTMFMRLQTQWTVVNTTFIGLNYQSIDFLFRIYQVQNPSEMMDDLRAMEVAALSVLNQSKE